MSRSRNAGPSLDDLVLAAMDGHRAWTTEEIAAKLDRSPFACKAAFGRLKKRELIEWDGERDPAGFTRTPEGDAVAARGGALVEVA
mgnify:CR=1 FL=1